MKQTGEDWVTEEFGGVQLGDQRLGKRLISLVENLAHNPQMSLPRALPDKASLKAAYRFFDNDDVEVQPLLEQHLRQAQVRARDHKTVLAIQDTSALDFHTHRATEGLGPTTTEGGWGLLTHNALVVSPERLALGVIFQRVWARDPQKVRIAHTRRERPIQNKESAKWLQGLQATNEFARDLDTQVVCVADREADIYDLFAADRLANVQLLIRAAWDRRVAGPQRHLWKAVEAGELVGQTVVNLPRQGKRPARNCVLDLRVCEVTLRPPKWRSAERLARIGIHVLWAVERHPAPQVEPVQWMLLSTLPVTNLEQALERLDWYCARWSIEVWHKVLKSGCRIESLQLGSATRLMRALAIYSVLAWRLMYATMLARATPELSAGMLLEPEEWQALYCAVHHTATPCSEPPTVRQAIRWIAQLGGFLGRKSDGEPGPQTIWQGLQALTQLTKMYCIMRPPPPGS